MESTSNPVFTLKRRDVFHYLHEKDNIANSNSRGVQEEIYNHFDLIYKISTQNEELQRCLKNKIRSFCNFLVEKWQANYRNISNFMAKNTDWLEEPLCDLRKGNKNRGRPKKSFSEGSEKTKRRIVEKLLSDHSPDKLLYAARLAQRTSGKRTLSKIIGEASSKSPKSLKKSQASKNPPSPYTPQEALCLIISLDLTKHQYVSLQRGAKERNCFLYPPYFRVLEEKANCYPAKSAITVTETKGEVELQGLLDHTTQRICNMSLLNEENLATVITDLDSYSYNMMYKWGFDGSSGHSLYKQPFVEGDDQTTDASIFFTCIVPLAFTAEHKTTNRKLELWKNPRTSSTRFCRPIRFQTIKETDENTRKEDMDMEKQISLLKSTIISFSENKIIAVNHKLFKTMVDGKVCSVLMEIDSKVTCYICGATPLLMNKIDNVLQRNIEPHSLNFGLSTLHSQIRFFECILHIAYRLELKKWKPRGEEERNRLLQRKTQIINRFREETGLLVDVVKPGAGTTNDGNSARRFFSDPAKSSEITGVDEELIYRFSVILQAITCGQAINRQAFRQYALETARHFVTLYPWYYMPVTVHKILVHGADVMDSFMLPIGQMSEDALEARHKEIRNFREFHTRKISRQATNEDLLNLLLASSDPLISSLRPLPSKSNKELLPEVLGLLST